MSAADPPPCPMFLLQDNLGLSVQKIYSVPVCDGRHASSVCTVNSRGSIHASQQLIFPRHLPLKTRPTLSTSQEFFPMRSILRTTLCAAVLTVFVAPAAQAQILSNGPLQVSLSATKVEVLSLSLSTATLTNSDLAANNVVGGLTASMTWALSPGRGNVHLVGWFSSTVAMTDGLATPNEVSVSDFLGACTSAGMTGATCSATPGAFTETNLVLGVPTATRVLWSSPAITGATRNQNGVAVGLSFSVASTRVATLPAGTYTGTLNLRAYAQ